MQIAVFRRAGWRAVLAGLAVSAAVGGWWLGQAPANRLVTGMPFANHSINVARSLAQWPLAFEPNQGQSDGRVLYLSRNPGYTLFLTTEEAVVALRGAARPVRLTWQGADPHPQVAGVETLPGKRNYLKGNDPAGWQRDIPTFGKVRYSNLYPGIDLVYYGKQRQLEYDLVVAPGADPAVICFRLAGMDTMKLDEHGALQLQVAQRSLSLNKPLVYQETAGKKSIVDGGYVLLADNQVGLRLAAYDHTKPLIIDPVLTYSTYLGGTGADLGMGVAVDGNGDVYMVGQTASLNFPLATKPATDTDVFVAKFDSSGTLQTATVLGGSGTDRGFAIAADTGAVYIVGDTTSSFDFPLPNGAQLTYGGGSTDAFVAKLNSGDLSLAFSTYLGGANGEEGLGIALDNATAGGNIYVAGSTLSNNFPTTTGSAAFNAAAPGNANCTDPLHPGSFIPCSDAYVAKYDNNGVKQYAVYLGGPKEDVATAIAVNSAGEVYVTGVTYSITGFLTTTAGFSQIFNGGLTDAFISKLANTGAVSYDTYLGGNGFDQGQAIALDNKGNVYVAGITNSDNLPVTNPAVQSKYAGGGLDAFVVKMNPNLSSQVQYLTYLGGSNQDSTVPNSGRDEAFGIAVNGASGVAYVVGETMSADFPEKSPLQSLWFGGGKNSWGDAFVAQIGATGALGWSTYLGGGGDDWANSVAVDGANGIYVAGSSFSSDFPTANPSQAGVAGNSDAILMKLTDTFSPPDLQVSASGAPDLVGTGETLTYTVAVRNGSTSFPADGVVIVATLPNGIAYKAATVPGGSCADSGAQVTCTLGSIAAGGAATTTITTTNNTAGDITFTAKVVRADQSYTDSTNNNSSASITTKAASGSSGGGGAWSLLDWVMGLMAYFAGRRRDARLR